MTRLKRWSLGTVTAALAATPPSIPNPDYLPLEQQAFELAEKAIAEQQELLK